MFHDLEERGYEMWSLIQGFVDPGTGRLLQLDAMVFRKPPILVEVSITKPESAAISD